MIIKFKLNPNSLLYSLLWRIEMCGTNTQKYLMTHDTLAYLICTVFEMEINKTKKQKVFVTQLQIFHAIPWFYLMLDSMFEQCIHSTKRKKNSSCSSTSTIKWNRDGNLSVLLKSLCDSEGYVYSSTFHCAIHLWLFIFIYLSIVDNTNNKCIAQQQQQQLQLNDTVVCIWISFDM